MKSTRKQRKPASAESIARLADHGKNVSRFFTNAGKMTPPVSARSATKEPNVSGSAKHCRISGARNTTEP